MYDENNEYRSPWLDWGEPVETVEQPTYRHGVPDGVLYEPPTQYYQAPPFPLDEVEAAQPTILTNAVEGDSRFEAPPTRIGNGTEIAPPTIPTNISFGPTRGQTPTGNQGGVQSSPPTRIGNGTEIAPPTIPTNISFGPTGSPPPTGQGNVQAPPTYRSGGYGAVYAPTGGPTPTLPSYPIPTRPNETQVAQPTYRSGGYHGSGSNPVAQPTIPTSVSNSTPEKEYYSPSVEEAKKKYESTPPYVQRRVQNEDGSERIITERNPEYEIAFSEYKQARVNAEKNQTGTNREAINNNPAVIDAKTELDNTKPYIQHTEQNSDGSERIVTERNPEYETAFKKYKQALIDAEQDVNASNSGNYRVEETIVDNRSGYNGTGGYHGSGSNPLYDDAMWDGHITRGSGSNPVYGSGSNPISGEGSYPVWGDTISGSGSNPKKDSYYESYKVYHDMIKGMPYEQNANKLKTNVEDLRSQTSTLIAEMEGWSGQAKGTCDKVIKSIQGRMEVIMKNITDCLEPACKATEELDELLTELEAEDEILKELIQIRDEKEAAMEAAQATYDSTPATKTESYTETVDGETKTKTRTVDNPDKATALTALNAAKEAYEIADQDVLTQQEKEEELCIEIDDLIQFINNLSRAIELLKSYTSPNGSNNGLLNSGKNIYDNYEELMKGLTIPVVESKTMYNQGDIISFDDSYGHMYKVVGDAPSDPRTNTNRSNGSNRDRTEPVPTSGYGTGTEYHYGDTITYDDSYGYRYGSGSNGTPSTERPDPGPVRTDPVPTMGYGTGTDYNYGDPVVFDDAQGYDYAQV